MTAAGTASTIAEAYALNDPAIAFEATGAASRRPSCRVRWCRPTIQTSSSRPSSGRRTATAVIVRLYEGLPHPRTVRLPSAFAVATAAKVNLLEEAIGDASIEDRVVVFDVPPFEIVTLRLIVGS